ncbi:MAG: hypothetical protein KJP05_04610, partial [Deltaproteobacteria bacterium]|nr:hypothetical protein [Deltaproteobacteria bacterium]
SWKLAKLRQTHALAEAPAGDTPGGDTATVWGLTMDHAVITANMEIPVRMVDTVVAATAPAGDKLQLAKQR